MKLLNWPIFYPFVKKNKKNGSVENFGVIPSYSYFLWVILGLVFPVLPFLIHYVLSSYFEFKQYFDVFYFKTIFLIIATIPIFYYGTSYVAFIAKARFYKVRIESPFFPLGFDPTRIYLIIAICFSLALLFVSYASMGDHLMNNVYSQQFPIYCNMQNFFYTKNILIVYGVVGTLFIFSLFLITHYSNFLLLPSSTNALKKNAIRDILFSSCSSDRFFSNYIPARCFREFDDYAQMAERLCLYLIFVRYKKTKQNGCYFNFTSFVFLYAPIWMPFITLSIGASYNVFDGTNALDDFKLIVWSSASSWAFFSIAYYHWLILVYLEPIFSRRERTDLKVCMAIDFESESLAEATTNFSSRNVVVVSQFILLTAAAGLIMFFSYLAY